MIARIDKKQLGPWALITGASSGIGKEFARQIAASGINVVLVARREPLLIEVGDSLAQDFGVEYRVVAADLSQTGFVEKLTEATHDLDLGLVVSNAGTWKSRQLPLHRPAGTRNSAPSQYDVASRHRASLR